MNSYYQEKLKLNYKEKIGTFIKSMEGIRTEHLPEPFLPVVGENYGGRYPKIVFWGWETRDAKRLSDWLDYVKSNEMNAFDWFADYFDEFAFVNWRSNFNNDFWSFNLKVLSAINGITDWQELYRNPSSYSELLSSFAWANTDSIERYEVTAKKQGATKENWTKLKEASSIFDSAKLIIDSLEPDIIILVNWNKEEDWLLEGLNIKLESEPQDFLWYYKTENPTTQIFWTSHPRGHNSKGINQDKIVSDISEIFKLDTK